MEKTFETASLSLEACTAMAKAAFEKANELEIKIAITIVDAGANTKYFGRMDHAGLIASDVSRKKAVTAVGFGMPTGDAWQNFIQDDPILNNGVHGIHDFMLLGGGSPVMIDCQLVGAVGVSGAHYKQDEQCTKAAIEAL